VNELDSPAQQDEWPDDVCDPCQSATILHLTSRHDQAWPLRFRVAVIQAQLPPITFNASARGSRAGNPTSRADLFCSFGRLTC
jgi:hypothetical protein